MQKRVPVENKRGRRALIAVEGTKVKACRQANRALTLAVLATRVTAALLVHQSLERHSMSSSPPTSTTASHSRRTVGID